MRRGTAGPWTASSSTHTSNTYEGDLGTMTMGYYESSDIPFYYDLAQNFTICDHYHCSVLGPTHPNRLLQMSGTLDPAGSARRTHPRHQLGRGCGIHVLVDDDARAAQDAGVSWKVYNPYGGNYTARARPFHAAVQERAHVLRAVPAVEEPYALPERL